MKKSRLGSARRAVAAAVAAAAFVAFPFAKPVDARIGTVAGAGIFFTVDSNWTVRLTNLTSITTDSAYHAVDTVYGTTDLDPNTSSGNQCSSSYDLCIQDADYGDMGWYGIADCPSGPYYGTNPTMTCGHHRVRINLRVNAWQGYDPYVAQSKFNLCHEVGHAVGLWHAGTPSTTCMASYSGTLGNHLQTISSTERSELNGWYK
jgi:hypothetical protein